MFKPNYSLAGETTPGDFVVKLTLWSHAAQAKASHVL